MGLTYEKNQRSLTDRSPRPRVSAKQSNFFLQFEPKQFEAQSVSVDFWFVSRNQKTFFPVCLGLFRCFGPVSKQPKQTEFSRSKPKKSPKNVVY
jgi:hypothetical protein